MYEKILKMITVPIVLLTAATCVAMNYMPGVHEQALKTAEIEAWLESQGAKGVYIDDALNVIFPLNAENSNTCKYAQQFHGRVACFICHAVELPHATYGDHAHQCHKTPLRGEYGSEQYDKHDDAAEGSYNEVS